MKLLPYLFGVFFALACNAAQFNYQVPEAGGENVADAEICSLSFKAGDGVKMESGKKYSYKLPNFPRIKKTNLYILCAAETQADGGIRVRIAGSDGAGIKSWVFKIGDKIGVAGGDGFDSCRKVGGDGKMFLCSAVLPESWKKGVVPVALEFMPYGDGGIRVFGATFSSKLVDTEKYVEFPEDIWKPINSEKLLVESGTVLDVSEHMGEKPAGKYGRVAVSKDGHFEFENRRGVRVKFKGTNWRPAQDFAQMLNSKEQIDKVVSRVRAQGYNLVRWRLSPDLNADLTGDFVYTPEVQDKYDYFIYACAREGVYSHIMLSSHLFGEKDVLWGDRFDVKVRFLLGDETVRENWKKSVRAMLEHVNPYTGKTWLEDASIATVECFNELDMIATFSPLQGMSKAARKYAEKFVRARLREKYGTIDALNEAWKPETPFKSFSKVKLLSNEKHFEMGAEDFSEIFVERSRNLAEFCRKFLRDELKLNAPMHQYNFTSQPDITLAGYEWGEYMGVNTYSTTYHTGFNPAKKIAWLSDPIADEDGRWFLYTIGKRVWGMPFMVSEFSQRHWNVHKYEAGVFFSAYSAFQDYDNLTVHDVAMADKFRYAPDNFSVFNSPVYRANEFLNYCMFFRGDVSPAKKRVEFQYTGGISSASVGTRFEKEKVAYMTGFGISFPEAERVSAGSLKNPDGTAVSPAKVSADAVYTSENLPENVAEFAADLRERGILPKYNNSNPEKGIFVSDTGEIEMRMYEGFVKVSTPKTEAVASRGIANPLKLGALTVKSVDVPCAVAACSMDGKKLSESSSVVLVLNTDNVSTDFKITAKKRDLRSWGKTPVRLRVCRLSAELEIADAEKFDLYALALTGERLEKLPVATENGVLKIDIDTSKLKDGTTVFFELVKRR